jgi:mannitol-1-phosphate 5-dehydrogenase
MMPIIRDFTIESTAYFDLKQRRKLYVHNMGHTLCACKGLLLGYRYVSDAISKNEVFVATREAMRESESAFLRAYGAMAGGGASYVDDLLRRFRNHALGDTCARGARDLTRKLAPDERFIGAVQFYAMQCAAKIEGASIAAGAGVAALCLLKERCMPPTRENMSALLSEVAGLSETPQDLPANGRSIVVSTPDVEALILRAILSSIFPNG